MHPRKLALLCGKSNAVSTPVFVLGAHSRHRETTVPSPSSLKRPLPSFQHKTAVDIRITRCLAIIRVSCKNINRTSDSGNSRGEFPYIITLYETSKKKMRSTPGIQEN